MSLLPFILIVGKLRADNVCTHIFRLMSSSLREHTINQSINQSLV